MGQKGWNTSGGLMRPDFLGMGRGTGGVRGEGELCVIPSDSILSSQKSIFSGTIAATWICVCTSGNKAPLLRKIYAGCWALLWLASPVRLLGEGFFVSSDHFWELWNWEEKLWLHSLIKNPPGTLRSVWLSAHKIFASAWLVCWITTIIKEIKSLAIWRDILTVLERVGRKFSKKILALEG